LLASKHCGLEALLVTISDLTAFWHVRSFHFILELNKFNVIELCHSIILLSWRSIKYY